MSVPLKISPLPHLAPPVLTAYLDINPGNPRNQGAPRGYITWLRSEGRALSQEVPQGARKALLAEVKRISDYLQRERMMSRGLVVFSGPRVWEVIPLQVEVTDELHWGKPSLHQMMWVLDEHRPRGAVLIDGSGARFFRFWLGEVAEDEAETFYADFSSWRKPHLVGPATSVVSKQHGVQRDRTRDRLAAQRSRFVRALAERIARWSAEEQISPVVLVGAPDETESIARELPPDFRRQTTIVRKIMPRISASEVKKKLEPILKTWEREYEASLVDELVSATRSGKAVTGIDLTLAELQKDRARELVVVRGITGAARECVKCGQMDRSADLNCAICGSERRPRTLRTVIPELASLGNVPVEVVSGVAARKLRAAGGMGAWLRIGEKRSSRQATGSGGR